MTTATATWEEIKRLAADFQRMQLLECTYKLSERNCIEIVNKLTSDGLIDVLHTIDGKEYITRQQVEKEIYDHLYFNSGRLNVSDLQILLNIDISHVESALSTITTNDSNVIYISGQVLNRDYLNKMAEDINDDLLEKGILLISEISTMYSLPVEFLHQMLKEYAGKLINAYLNDTSVYTQSFIHNQKSLLIGALEASCKPIRLSQIRKEYSINMLHGLMDELLSSNELNGTFFGSKQESCVYIPNTYTNVQKSYIESFFKQNGYIDYASLKKLGVTEPEAYAKNLLSSTVNKVQYYTTCCIGEYLLDQVESNLDDALTTSGYCDLISLLPSVIDQKDYVKISNYFQNKLKEKQSSATYTTVVLLDVFFVTQEQIKKVYDDHFDSKINIRVLNDMKNENILMKLKQLGDGTSSGSSGGTKGGKAKGKSQANSNSELLNEFVFIDEANLKKELGGLFDGMADDFLNALSDYMLRTLNKRYVERLKQKLESLSQVQQDDSNKNESTTASSSGTKPKSLIKTTQDKVKTLYINAKIFLKAVKSINSEKSQEAIGQHIKKTLLSDMFNELVKFGAEEQMVPFDAQNLNNDTRNKIIQKLKEPNKARLVEVQNSFDKKTPFEVIDIIEKASSELLELQFKKLDNKKEKEVLLELREQLVKSLEEASRNSDGAVVLQLVAIILYFDSTNLMLNIPGKCVPDVLDALKTSVNEESHKKLVQLQNFVLKQLKASNDGATSDEEKVKLINDVKQLAFDKSILVRK